MTESERLLSQAQVYAHRNNIRWDRIVELGHGMDGAVWGTSKPSAIKAIRLRKNYSDELECYRRLLKADVRHLCGFAVPRLFGADDELQVIEISVVQKPRLLDFGKVYLDGAEKQVYQAGELERARYAASREYKEDWPKVAALLHVLQTKFGICYVDPRPGNIDCGESEKEDPDWDKEPEIDYSEYD